MKETETIRDLTEDIIEISREDAIETGEIKHISNYYRLRVDNNMNVFVSSLPSYVSRYRRSDVHSQLLRIGDNEDKRVVLDIISEFEDWCYLRGFKEKENLNREIDVSRYADDSTERLMEEMNREIRSSDTRIQDVFLAMTLAHLAFRWVDDGHYDTTEEFSDILEEVSVKIQELVQNYRENTNIPFSWNAVGSSLDYTERELEILCARQQAGEQKSTNTQD